MTKQRLRWLGLLFILCTLSAVRAEEPAQTGSALVNKDIGNFAPGQWIKSPWNRAPGQVSGVGQLDVVVNFTGKGFEHFTVQPQNSLVIPGVTKKVSIRFKADAGYGLSLKFNDGWGRGEIPGKKFEWNLPNKTPGEWTEATFSVPADWVMPLEISGLSTHNWGKDKNKAEFPFSITELKVETDISDVDPATGKLRSWQPEPSPADPAKARKECPSVPLVVASITSGQISNVFAGEEPGVRVVLTNWKPGEIKGVLKYKVFDNDGAQLLEGQNEVKAGSFGESVLPLPVQKFGRYRLEAVLTLEDGTEIKEDMVFAKLPALRELSAEEKLRSPYGMNIHAGKPNGDLNSYIPPFVKAGLVWYRDYAWAYGWTERAKGEDNKFRGWPYYDKIVQQAQDMGIMLVPCMMKSIRMPEDVDGKVVSTPADREWAQHLVLLMNAFPELKYWELDNEYDLHDISSKLEPRIDWANYRQYHKFFANVVTALGGGELIAVENGRAGIHPEKIADCVRSGDFANIGVVNSHHYCGIEAPELNGSNMNTGGGGEAGTRKVRSFFDSMRDAKRLGSLDGKKREHWLTEFGWDTLAGKVVTPYQQAVYLQRGWLLAIAAGTDKCFWFFDNDNPNPNNFFDGCGLLGPGPKLEPKLALSSMAGMSHILPSPEYIGSLYAGDGTWGYLFKQYDKLVAVLWMLETDEGIEVELAADKVYDYLGNVLPQKKVRLNMSPIYAEGVGEDSKWYMQSAYELESQYVDAAAAGDRVTQIVAINNNRKTKIKAEIFQTLPEGWQELGGKKEVEVEPGKSALVELPCVISRTESIGRKPISISISENGELVKKIVATVQVREPLGLEVSPLGNRPGDKEVRIKATNLSASPRGGKIDLKLPASWRAQPQSVQIEKLEPGENRELLFTINWSTDIKDGETATAVFSTPEAEPVSRPLIPGAMTMHRAQGITVDGNLSDWGDKYRLPEWTVGATLGEPGVKIWSAWAPEGLYIAMQVEDSRLNATDPRSFWLGDCLELFIDTADDKKHREFEPGDHQFWLVPQTEAGTVFAGQWKRKDEIAQIIYDVPGVKGVSRREGDGYVLEVLLPTAALQKYAPKTGGRIGLNINLTVKGARYDREVFWPEAKNWGIMNLPKHWGSVELID